MSDSYQFYYWPSIQGRGEFVRLALEEAGAPYVDVARTPESKGGGVKAMMKVLHAPGVAPFAPPFLRAGDLVIAQTANILSFLGPRHGLLPEDEAGRFHASQLQLTITDVVAEAHNTHHPVATGLYYEDQKAEAVRAGAHFATERIPKYLGYFERAVAATKGPYIFGERVSTVDLSLFQLMEGLTYAFPSGTAAMVPKVPALLALCEQVRSRPRIAAYLASPRRLPFSEEGIFRHYPELDVVGQAS